MTHGEDGCAGKPVKGPAIDLLGSDKAPNKAR
jgi:hypothetical protein